MKGYYAFVATRTCRSEKRSDLLIAGQNADSPAKVRFRQKPSFTTAPAIDGFVSRAGDGRSSIQAIPAEASKRLLLENADIRIGKAKGHAKQSHTEIRRYWPPRQECPPSIALFDRVDTIGIECEMILDRGDGVIRHFVCPNRVARTLVASL